MDAARWARPSTVYGRYPWHCQVWLQVVTVFVMDQMNKGQWRGHAPADERTDYTKFEVPGAQRRDPPQAADADKEWQPSCMLTDDVEAGACRNQVCYACCLLLYYWCAVWNCDAPQLRGGMPPTAMSGAGISHCAANLERCTDQSSSLMWAYY
jgi:hypothetical protein